MAVAGWVLDKSAAARAEQPGIGAQLDELAGSLYVCPVGRLQQLYSARSSRDYDVLKENLTQSFEIVQAPADVLDRALALQEDLAITMGCGIGLQFLIFSSRRRHCITTWVSSTSTAATSGSRRSDRLPSGGSR